MGAGGGRRSRREGEADAAELEVRRQRLALEVVEDVVAVALGDEFYVKGDWYRQERRKAGDARWTCGYRATPSLFAAVHSRKYA